MKSNIFYALAILVALLAFNSCSEEYSCTDGEQNQGETGIDCGDLAGNCPPCLLGSSCSDGVQNGGELGIDCGGPCPACASSCTDGIQNGDEEGIDCGGSCPDTCPESSCTDGIQNGDEEGVDCGGSCPDDCIVPAGIFTVDIDGIAFEATNVSASNFGGGLIVAGQSADGNTVISITHDGAFEVGTYDIAMANANYNVLPSILSSNVAVGTITFTTFDTTTNTVSGTFSFESVDPTSNITYVLSNGVFEDVTF